MALKVYIRNEDADSNNGLANATAATASARAVVRGLSREGRDPDDDEEAIDGKHNIRVGESASAAESRSHDKVNPSWDGNEALEATKRQPSPCLVHKPPQHSETQSLPLRKSIHLFPESWRCRRGKRQSPDTTPERPR